MYEQVTEGQEVDSNQTKYEDIVDPEDPLYGLDQRLKGLALDEASKRIIKDKLTEASNKIKQGLE